MEKSHGEAVLKKDHRSKREHYRGSLALGPERKRQQRLLVICLYPGCDAEERMADTLQAGAVLGRTGQIPRQVVPG